MTDINRVNDVARLSITKSVGEIAEMLHLKQSSVERYMRLFKHEEHEADTSAKVLLLDIETIPSVGYFWSPWNTNISADQIVEDGCMLSFSVKYLFQPEMYSEILTPKEALARDDSRIVKIAWEYLSDCQIVIAHNGKAFDTQYLNARFIFHNLTPPSPYKIIDTLHIKKNTRFTMNSLEYLCKHLGLRPKMDTGGFGLWKECMAGNRDSLKKMKEYNENDVLALEELYVRLRAWLPSHPNMALYYANGNKSRCIRCSSEKIEYVGQYATTVNLYNSYRCMDCGAIFRERKSATPTKHYQNLRVNIPIQ